VANQSTAQWLIPRKVYSDQEGRSADQALPVFCVAGAPQQKRYCIIVLKIFCDCYSTDRMTKLNY
jgi:hypothetical protein